MRRLPLTLLLLTLLALPANAKTRLQSLEELPALLAARTACLLINAHLLPMSDAEGLGAIAKGYLLLDETGHIDSLGAMEDLPDFAGPRIDCDGAIVTPGLINASTALGLAGLPAIGITNDSSEASERFLPHLRALDGFNPGDKGIPRVRAAGVTTVYVAPGENTLINGQGVILKLRNTPDVDRMVLRAPAGLHLALGNSVKSTWDSRGGPSTRMGVAAVIRQEFIATQNWQQGHAKYERELAEYERKIAAGETTNKDGDPLEPPDPPERNLQREAIAMALTGEIPVIISCWRQDDILTALRIAEEFELTPILAHASGGWQVADQIREADVPVLVGPVRVQPASVQTLAARPDTAALLNGAGIPIAIATGTDEGGIGGIGMGDRALAHEAAWAAASGLGHDDALRAITSWPADILGIADRVGRLAPGLDADLVIWSGDPLDMKSRARYVLIDGICLNDYTTLPPFPSGPGW